MFGGIMDLGTGAGRLWTALARAPGATSFRRAVLLLLVSGALYGACAALPGSAAAFDVGYHYDLSKDTLAREGFDASAVQVVQVTNCYDDMFQSAKEVLRDDRAAALHEAWDAIYGPEELRDISDDYQHFDDYPDNAALAAAWDRLLVGTWAAVQDVKQRPKETRAVSLLAVLGQSLHQVQDFYAHSNWAHFIAYPDWSHPANTIRDETWFDVSDRRRGDLALRSGPHDLMHKDWAGRPHFDRAYHEAFLASREWVEMVRAWAGAPLWEEAAAYSDHSVAQEAQLLERLAMYAADGSWKGPGSGDTTELTDAALAYRSYHVGLWSPWSTPQTQDSYLLAWKHYCPIINDDPNGKPLPPTLPSPVTRPVWMAIDTLLVGELHGQGNAIDAGTAPDFFAVLEVNGVDYVTDIMGNQDDFSPANWKTWVPLDPGSAVSLTYALWDADVTDDELCDIFPGAPRSWMWSGPMDWLPASLIETQGSGGEGSAAFVHFRLMREPFTTAETADPIGEHGWYNSSVRVELVGHDLSGTGIDRLDYGVTEDTATVFAEYEGPFSLSREGTNTLHFFATDRAGNLEDAQEKTFRIDSRRPTPVALNHPTAKRFGQCVLKYVVHDPLPSSDKAMTTIKVRSSTGKVVKTLGGKIWQSVNSVWTARFSPGNLKRGRYSYSVYATDYAGNPQDQVAESYIIVK